jgi:hypothetical protein
MFETTAAPEVDVELATKRLASTAPTKAFVFTPSLETVVPFIELVTVIVRSAALVPASGSAVVTVVAAVPADTSKVTTYDPAVLGAVQSTATG